MLTAPTPYGGCARLPPIRDTSPKTKILTKSTPAKAAVRYACKLVPTGLIPSAGSSHLARTLPCFERKAGCHSPCFHYASLSPLAAPPQPPPLLPPPPSPSASPSLPFVSIQSWPRGFHAFAGLPLSARCVMLPHHQAGCDARSMCGSFTYCQDSADACYIDLLNDGKNASAPSVFRVLPLHRVPPSVFAAHVKQTQCRHSAQPRLAPTLLSLCCYCRHMLQ